MDQSDIQPNRKKKKKRKSLLRRATELTGLVTAALALGGAYFTHVPAQIPQPDAKRFLARYFEGAPRDPDKVLTALTTTEFQEGQELNEESYADFWSRVERVDDLKVSPSRDELNVFTTSWRFIYRNGKLVPARSRLQLDCEGWRAWVPLVMTCDADHIRLDASLGID